MNPETTEHYYRVSIKALVLDETRKKFLVAQEDNGMWELPGGGLEHGESPRDALQREIKEEMGLAVTWVAETPSFFISFNKKTDKDFWMNNVLYETKLPSLEFTPSDECIAVRFVTSEEALTLPAFSNVYELAKMFGNKKVD